MAIWMCFNQHRHKDSFTHHSLLSVLLSFIYAYSHIALTRILSSLEFFSRRALCAVPVCTIHHMFNIKVGDDSQIYKRFVREVWRWGYVRNIFTHVVYRRSRTHTDVWVFSGNITEVINVCVFIIVINFLLWRNTFYFPSIISCHAQKNVFRMHINFVASIYMVNIFEQPHRQDEMYLGISLNEEKTDKLTVNSWRT